MVAADGTTSRSISRSFGPTSTANRVTPVKLPPGAVQAGDEPNLHGIADPW